MNVGREAIIEHYVAVWANQPQIRRWNKGPTSDLPTSFCILEFCPTAARDMWTYSTCGMSSALGKEPLELHLFSPQQYEPLVELLTVVAHYHCTNSAIGLGHTVNFGRPWISGSQCDHGLVSLPYLDGPGLGEFRPSGQAEIIHFLWLIPITKAERDYKKSNGFDAIQKKLEDGAINYIDPVRPSVV